MSCPHSTAPGSAPHLCSLCLQSQMSFDVHRIVVDRQGIVSIDDTPLGRLSDINRAKYQAETAAIGPPNKTKKCSNCDQVGHNARTCNSNRKDDVSAN